MAWWRAGISEVTPKTLVSEETSQTESDWSRCWLQRASMARLTNGATEAALALIFSLPVRWVSRNRREPAGGVMVTLPYIAVTTIWHVTNASVQLSHFISAVFVSYNITHTWQDSYSLEKIEKATSMQCRSPAVVCVCYAVQPTGQASTAEQPTRPVNKATTA